jgi:hypothetical protein
MRKAIQPIVVAVITGVLTAVFLTILGLVHIPTSSEMSAIHDTQLNQSAVLAQHSRALEDARLANVRIETKTDLLLSQLASLRVDFDKSHPRAR